MSKKKLIITVTSLCLVLVAAVAAVVAVLAASQQNVRANLSVSYSANNVKATATLAYQYESTNTWYDPEGTGNAASQSFLVTNGTSTKDLMSGGLQLGREESSGEFNRYVIYRFGFHNDYATGTGRNVKITLTYTSANVTATNVLVGWASVGAGSTAFASADAPALDISGWIDNQQTFVDATSPANYTTTVPFSTTGNELVLAPEQYGYVYMVVAIQNVDLDASYSTSNGAISFALEAVTPAQPAQQGD